MRSPYIVKAADAHQSLTTGGTALSAVAPKGHGYVVVSVTPSAGTTLTLRETRDSAGGPTINHALNNGAAIGAGVAARLGHVVLDEAYSLSLIIGDADVVRSCIVEVFRL